MNCDRETPWLPKEDFRDEKVYSKEGTSRTTSGAGAGRGNGNTRPSAGLG